MYIEIALSTDVALAAEQIIDLVEQLEQWQTRNDCKAAAVTMKTHAMEIRLNSRVDYAQWVTTWLSEYTLHCEGWESVDLGAVGKPATPGPHITSF